MNLSDQEISRLPGMSKRKNQISREITYRVCLCLISCSAVFFIFDMSSNIFEDEIKFPFGLLQFPEGCISQSQNFT